MKVITQNAKEALIHRLTALGTRAVALTLEDPEVPTE